MVAGFARGIGRQSRARLVERCACGRGATERIEVEAVEPELARHQTALDRLHQRAVAERVLRYDAEPPRDRLRDCALIAFGKAAEHRDQRFGVADRAQRDGKLHRIPMNRLRLAAKGVKAVMVEIGGGEARVPSRREAPRAVIETLAGHVDIVGVEHAVDEACRHVAGGQRRGAIYDEIEQPRRCILARVLAIKVAEDIADQPLHILGIAQVSEALEGADADMAVTQPDQYRRAGGGGLVAAFERFAGFDQREAARGVDAQRLEHFGGEHFAYPPFERQAAVAEAAPRRRARSLGGEVHQAPARVAQLRKQEAASVANLGIILAELVAVIAQRKWLFEAVGQRFEATEMRQPRGVA